MLFHHGAIHYLYEWERLWVARAKSPCKTIILWRQYPGRTNSTVWQRRLAAEDIWINHSIRASGCAAICQWIIPFLMRWRVTGPECCIPSTLTRLHCHGRFLELPRTWAHWQLRSFPSIRGRKCRSCIRGRKCRRLLLKCFSVQCQEILLHILYLELQCGNLPYQFISCLKKSMRLTWWVMKSWDKSRLTIVPGWKIVTFGIGFSGDKLTWAALGPKAFSSAPRTTCWSLRCFSSCRICIRWFHESTVWKNQ